MSSSHIMHPSVSVKNASSTSQTQAAQTGQPVGLLFARTSSGMTEAMQVISNSDEKILTLMWKGQVIRLAVAEGNADDTTWTTERVGKAYGSVSIEAMYHNSSPHDLSPCIGMCGVAPGTCRHAHYLEIAKP